MDNNKTNSPYQIFHQVMGLHYYRLHKLLEKEGIYPGQPPLLIALHKEDGQSQKELAQALGVQPATITMMVKRMAKAGLIKRRRDEEDQRISRVYLTLEGENTRKKAEVIIEKIENECFGPLSEAEGESLKNILLKMKQNILSVCGDNAPPHMCQRKGSDL